MKRALLSAIVFLFSYSGFSQCVTNVDFNTWSVGGNPANGNWVTQSGGSVVHQTINNNPTFYLSPFDLMNVHITGNFRTTDNDNDWMGFVFSYLNPIGNSDTFDCWLYDWKQEPQGASSSGMSLDRLDGYLPPSTYNPQFWDHVNAPGFTVIQNTFGGAGWQQNFNHAFEIFLTYTRVRINVDGQPIFDHQDCFKPGRFGFYNLSQQDCYYSNFNYELFIDFRFPQPGVCLGQPASLEFIDPCVTTLGQYQNLTWNFGDGTPNVVITNPTLANVNVNHTYAAAGNYTASLTVTDMNGCSATGTHTIVVRNPIALTPTLTPPACNGGSTGTAAVSATGGFGSYNYQWNNGQTAATVPGLSAGTYTVTVSDAACQTTAQYTLTQPTALTATTSHIDAPCGSNGSATINISGGTPPYSGINWAGIAGSTASLPAGTWIADFHDANGCSALLQYTETITGLPCGLTSSVTKTDVTCFGANTGSITLTVTPPGGSVSWSNGGSGFTLNNLIAGTYTYNYTDGNPAHAFSGSVTITQPTAPMTVQVTATPIACAGSSTGQVVASVISGGVPTYHYAWSGGGPDSAVYRGLAAGTRTVTVTDANLCTGTASATISSVPSLAINMITIIDSCYHSGKGRVTAAVSGGSPPYNYSWNNFSIDSAVYNAIAGPYSVTVTDFNSCSMSATATVTGPAAPLTRTFTRTDVLCNGNTTGAFAVTAAGGTPGYNYAWTPNTVSGSNPTGLAAGIYSMTITDNYGCTALLVDTIVEPATALSAPSSHTNVSCHGGNDGMIVINLSGGTAPYTYQGTPIPAGSDTLRNLTAGNYNGTITDAHGCTVTVNETITEPGVQSLTVSNTNEPCNGATTATASANFVNATGSVVYNWTGGLTGANLSNLAAGTYNVTATDANNCVQTGGVTVTEPAAPVMTVTATDAACFGGNGSATANPTGGTTPYTYNWSGGGSGATTNPPAGSYTVTASDAGGCNQTAAFTINQPTQIVVQVQQTNVNCFGQSTGDITLTVSGGTGATYTYTWNPPVSTSNTATNLAAGNYDITVADQASCTVDTTVVITEPAAPLANVVDSTDVTCFGAGDGTITLTTTGGTTAYAYNWSPNVSSSNSASSLTAGQYDITITDANSCTLTESVTIIEPTVLASTQSQTDLVCYGVSTGVATVNVTGGTVPYGYSWTQNVSTDSTATSLAAGTYGVTVTDDHSCTITATFTLTEPPQLTVSKTQTNVLCFGTSTGDITLTAGGGTPGYTYGWNPNVSTANTASNLPAASYGITVTDANTCTATITVVITEPAQLDVIATATDALCFGQANGTITATGSGGVTPFNYTASSGGSVLNSANGQFASVAAGTYMVYVNDNNQCVDSTSVTVNEPAQLTVLAVPVDVTCYHYTDGQIAVTSTGGTVPYTFSLSNGDQNGGGNFSSLATGTYTITVSDANNCTLTTSAVISEPDSVTLTVTPDPIKLNLGESIQLQTSTNWTGGSVTYNWQPAMGLDCYDCASPIFSGNYSAEYYVTMVTNTGCTGTSHVSVTVVPNYDVFVPNVFTPNGDGVNDTWNIFGNIPGIKQLEVAVFNRIGEKVFQTNDINFNWDGMYKGTFCPPGVYVYTAKFVWVNNHSDANYKGTVTLLR